jgi:bis(5'-nucleosyl)-tetraphosphatase (symmetrical)
MATYAIGDVQGCFAELQRLLGKVGFDPVHDRVWLVGDLVNRGPRSLDVLRWVKGLGDRAVCVLGNHDLHLLARGYGVTHPKSRDTLGETLAAPDRKELFEWLRGLPLLYREDRWVMVHAGLLPSWTLDDAEGHARAAESALRSSDPRPFLASWPRPVKVLANIRTCRADGSMCADFKGAPADAPTGCTPWFAQPHARGDVTVIFGHWAALGFQRGDGYLALDSGCVWGEKLTCVRLEDGAVFQEDADR